MLTMVVVPVGKGMVFFSGNSLFFGTFGKNLSECVKKIDFYFMERVPTGAFGAPVLGPDPPYGF